MSLSAPSRGLDAGLIIARHLRHTVQTACQDTGELLNHLLRDWHVGPRSILLRRRLSARHPLGVSAAPLVDGPRVDELLVRTSLGRVATPSENLGAWSSGPHGRRVIQGFTKVVWRCADRIALMTSTMPPSPLSRMIACATPLLACGKKTSRRLEHVMAYSQSLAGSGTYGYNNVGLATVLAMSLTRLPVNGTPSCSPSGDLIT
ncbi:hypothetical protein KC335_g52 [Hortaea werneckii]|nr:hypothetical protein KC335_g52 [Hortaea werneckii]